MIYLSFILRVIVWLFAIVKIVEIVQYLCWTLKRGSQYREKLLGCLKHGHPLSKDQLHELDETYRVPWPIPWRLHRRFGDHAGNMSVMFRMLLASNRFFGQWIDRQPTLVVAIAVILILAPDIYFSPIEIGLLLVLMFAELANTLCARAVLGFADNFRRDFTVDPTTFKDVYWSGTSFLPKFIFGIGIFLGTTIFGFGAIYFAVYVLSHCSAFEGLLTDGTPPLLQLMYFSVVTMATVGYGDIHPNLGIIQMLTALEIIFGTGVIVFLLFSLSNTFTFDTRGS